MRDIQRNTTLTEVLLDPILERAPAAPRITWYDDSTGARVELSGLTLANWAAKTANLLRDGFALPPAARVSVLLPAHWQTAAVLLGCWWAGTEVVLHPDPDAELAFSSVQRLRETETIDEVVAVGLDAMGGPIPRLPIGVTDYAGAARVHGDHFRPGAAGVALEGSTVAQVIEAADESARRQALLPQDRVLSTADWDTPEELIDGLLAVLAAGASLVQVRNPDPAREAARCRGENITTHREKLSR